MEVSDLFINSIGESFQIILIIFLMMVIIEFVVLKFKEKILFFVEGKKLASYVVSSFFGIIPGCIGTFAMDSLYMSGLLSFGGIIAVMISTSGDEAFLMLAMASRGQIPWLVILSLTSILFVLGVIAAFIADFIKHETKMTFCERCSITHHGKEEFKPKHFLKKHIIDHIIKKHLWKIFIWLFASLFIIGLLQEHINLNLSGASMFYVLLVASLVGVLPISGPNVFLVVMFSKGMIPFSILLANSIIQDGHGLLPIIGFSLDDALKIKLFNFLFGLAIGIVLLAIGL